MNHRLPETRYRNATIDPLRLASLPRALSLKYTDPDPPSLPFFQDNSRHYKVVALTDGSAWNISLRDSGKPAIATMRGRFPSLGGEKR